jgi:hypothetical protein
MGLGLAVLLVGILAWWYRPFLRAPGGPEPASAQVPAGAPANVELQRNLTAALAETERLRGQLEVLERSGQIEREAHRLAQQALLEQQTQTRAMEEELGRLRPLAKAKAEPKGPVHIADFKLTATDQERQFNYQLRVVQSVPNPAALTGGLRISVQGAFGATRKRLTLRDLTPERIDEQPLRFRQAQTLDGRLRLPPGFVPDGVILELRLDTKGIPPLTESFDWVAGG